MRCRRIAVPGAPAGLGLRAVGKFPARADEVTGVAVRVALEIILVLRLDFPEGPGGRQLGNDLARPETRGLDIGDRVLGDPLLPVGGVENGRPVTQADIAALPVARGRIVDLKEKFQQRSVADDRRIEA
jgi:hypothetical protein